MEKSVEFYLEMKNGFSFIRIKRPISDLDKKFFSISIDLDGVGCKLKDFIVLTPDEANYMGNILIEYSKEKGGKMFKEEINKGTVFDYEIGRKIYGNFHLQEYTIVEMRKNKVGKSYILRSQYGEIVNISEEELNNFFKQELMIGH